MRRVRVALAVAGVAAASAVTALAATSWQLVASPNVSGSNFDQLNGALVSGPGEAWASGFSRVGSGPFRALLEHWTGSTWQIATSASIAAADDTRLVALAKTTPTDVWAVGSDTPSGGTSAGLIEHWSGTTWARSARATGEPAGSTLNAVSADSAADAWAVGWFSNSDTFGFQPLLEHWNGAAWNVVTGAAFPGTGYDRLLAVSALSPTDVWVLGVTGRHSVPLIEHWNGTAWSLVQQPAHGYNANLQAISAVSPTDIWAVGGQNVTDTLIEHWNGSQWSIVPSPDGSGFEVHSFLTGVAALAANNVYAVGGLQSLGVPSGSLSEHWDGKTWSVVSSPPAAPASLNAVAGVASGPLVAAGYQDSSSYQERTLILQH